MRTGTKIGRRALFTVGSVCLLIGCSDTTTPSVTGRLDVSVTTAGAETDPDGFEVLVDDQERGSLPAAGSAVITGLEPGPHTVGLGGVAPTCKVTTGNPLTIEIQAGASTSLTFGVSCSTPVSPAPTGALRVVSHTTGSSLDPDGYTVRVDGQEASRVGIEDTLVVSELGAGDYLVEFADIASNCTVTGGASRSAVITPPDTVTLPLAVSCAASNPKVATIIVSIATQVINGPQGGFQYTVVLDGVQSQSVGSSGRVTFQTVAGRHSVLLGHVPGYCSVGGFFPQPNLVSVTISAGEVKTVRFSVLCIG